MSSVYATAHAALGTGFRHTKTVRDDYQNLSGRGGEDSFCPAPLTTLGNGTCDVRVNMPSVDVKLSTTCEVVAAAAAQSSAGRTRGHIVDIPTGLPRVTFVGGVFEWGFATSGELGREIHECG